MSKYFMKKKIMKKVRGVTPDYEKMQADWAQLLALTS